jgi:hypothetical protein
MCRGKRHKLDKSRNLRLVLWYQPNIGNRKSVKATEISLLQGNTNFPNIYGPTQNFRRQNDDRKEVPYWGRKILGANVQNFVAIPGLFDKGQNKKDRRKSRSKRMTLRRRRRKGGGGECEGRMGSKRKLWQNQQRFITYTKRVLQIIIVIIHDIKLRTVKIKWWIRNSANSVCKTSCRYSCNEINEQC